METNQKNTLTNEQLAWLAGFFDGEGSIIIGKSGIGRSNYLQLAISICQTRLIPLRVFKEHFGGSLYYRDEDKKWSWLWQLGGRKASDFLESIKPFLIVKAEEADIAIEFQKLKTRNNKKRLTKEEIRQRESLSNALRDVRSQIKNQNSPTVIGNIH